MQEDNSEKEQSGKDSYGKQHFKILLRKKNNNKLSRKRAKLIMDNRKRIALKRNKTKKEEERTTLKRVHMEKDSSEKDKLENDNSEKKDTEKVQIRKGIN